MYNLKSISDAEFQKCGEIFVAAKRNKFAMSCNFCREVFTHLHPFMRHLKIQHDNQLAFHKQAKEVEVYAVEELLNQSVVSSSVFDIKNNASEEDAKWLSEAGIKWLDEGVEPNINQQHNRNFKMLNREDKEESLVLTNMSILKALEDCDVSLNIMHNKKDAKCSAVETESYLDNALLQEIQNDDEHSDNNESIFQGIDCTEMAAMSHNNTSTDENLNQTKTTYENSPTKCLKQLLQGLENLDDVDSLLEILESETTNKSNKVVNVEKHSKRNNCLLSAESEGQILNFKQHFNKKGIESTIVVLEMNSDVQSNKLEGLKTRFKEFTNALDGAGTSNISTKAKKNEPIPKISQICKPGSVALKGIEETPHNLNHISYNIIINNSDESQHDFEIKLKNLEESFNDSEILEENITASESNISLNEDLTKALADALDAKEMDLFNIQQVEAKEPLNDDILKVLERELIADEKKQELPLLKDQHTLNAKVQLNALKAIETFKKERKSESCHESNVIAKYQKTNLTAKTRVLKTENQTSIKHTKCLVPTEFNSINSIALVQDSQKQLKGNHAIYFNQKQLTSLTNTHKSPAKALTSESSMGKISENFGQIKIPIENQENSAIASNMQNIKKETLTPFSNFVNMNRGDKTPIKREQIFFKQSPKTQEKLETLVNDTTPQMRKIKQSPKTQEKQENFILQLKLQEDVQKTFQLKNEDKLKQSIEISNTIKQSDQKQKLQNVISKKQKKKSPIKCLNKTYGKSLYNHAKTSLTAPNKSKNLAIELPRNTTDKLKQQLKKQDGQISETKQQIIKDGKKQIFEHFKLPDGISLTKVPKQSSTSEADQCDITPIKTTVYCKQNFSEASLESADLYEIKKQTTAKVSSSLSQAQRQNNKNLKTEANFAIVRQRKASIDILPSRNVKQTTQISAHKTSRNSNLDYNSCAINRSARKKEVLQRMHKIKKQIFKSIEERECINKIEDAKLQFIKRQKKEILVQNIQILPNLNNTTNTPLILSDLKKPFENYSIPITNSVSPKNLADDEKQAKLAMKRSQNFSSNNDNQKLIKKSLKRRTSAPLNKCQAKRQHKSPIKEQTKVEVNTSDLEGMQLDLSESAVDFLQRDLKANRLNVESLLNEDLHIDDYSPNENSAELISKETKIKTTSNEEGLNCSNILNDLLEQVENEQNTKDKRQKGYATSKDKTLAFSTTFEDFDDARDIDLLDKLGLKIIKLPEIEDDITLEERDAMSEKAVKFAGIYKKWPKIWSTKNSSNPTTKEEVNASFEQLLTETNQSFNLALSIVEIKRLANLINIWYAGIFNNKFIEKRKISDSINRYICIFFYVPRTIKRYYFCEYCSEYFNTEHRYFTHRITHTGALFPYNCQKCSVGFKTVKQLNNHETSCKKVISDKTYQSVKKVMVTSSKAKRKSTTRNNCSECAEPFATSKQLNEHTKKHLKSSYSCVKCKVVFATAMEIQNHMTKCNYETKHMPKPHTLRPLRHY